jgi:hypothetical protein
VRKIETRIYPTLSKSVKEIDPTMALHVIPFNMPEPMEIPAHIVEQLRQLPAGEAIDKGMGLLMQIEAADIILFERIDAEGFLQLESVMGKDGSLPDVLADLQQESFYGQAPAAESGLAGQAIEQGKSLLVMGQLEAGEDSPMPQRLATRLVGEGGGNAGFLYVLRLTDAADTSRGVLTLIRGAGDGPLNHEQPNITEAMRRLLSELLSAES